MEEATLTQNEYVYDRELDFGNHLDPSRAEVRLEVSKRECITLKLWTMPENYILTILFLLALLKCGWK
jgi:hypothetical protein